MSETAHLLRKAQRMISREWMLAQKDIGLTQSEHDYLSAVYEQEALQRFADQNGDHHGQHLQDVVEALGVSKASASAMMTKLEKRGLVTRRVCFMDARAQHIILTQDGHAMLAQGNAVYDRVAALMKDDLKVLI
ncbi:MarR family winged helix-turn-helix transcriptional regulator [Celeribacter sp. ULVN23_4]